MYSNEKWNSVTEYSWYSHLPFHENLTIAYINTCEMEPAYKVISPYKKNYIMQVEGIQYNYFLKKSKSGIIQQTMYSLLRKAKIV